MDNKCKTCEEEIFYDECRRCWMMRIENSNWDYWSDWFDYQDIPVKYCYECGKKLK